MSFKIIITTDSNYGISRYNKMAWHSIDDLKFFIQFS